MSTTPSFSSTDVEQQGPSFSSSDVEQQGPVNPYANSSSAGPSTWQKIKSDFGAGQDVFDQAAQSEPLDTSSVGGFVKSVGSNIGAGATRLLSPLVHPVDFVEGAALNSPPGVLYQGVRKMVQPSYQTTGEQTVAGFKGKPGGEAVANIPQAALALTGLGGEGAAEDAAAEGAPPAPPVRTAAPAGPVAPTGDALTTQIQNHNILQNPNFTPTAEVPPTALPQGPGVGGPAPRPGFDWLEPPTDNAGRGAFQPPAPGPRTATADGGGGKSSVTLELEPGPQGNSTPLLDEIVANWKQGSAASATPPPPGIMTKWWGALKNAVTMTGQKASAAADTPRAEAAQGASSSLNEIINQSIASQKNPKVPAPSPLQIGQAYISSVLAGIDPTAAAAALGMTPQHQELAHTAAFFTPKTTASLVPPSPVKAGAPPAPPQGPPPSASTIQQTAQAKTIAEAAAAAQNIGTNADQIAAGIPPPKPPSIPLPQGMADGHLSQQVIDTAGKVITSLPPPLQPKAILEATGSLATWLFQQKTAIGPDGKVVNVDSQKAAQTTAVGIINAEVDRQAEQAKAAQEAQQDAAKEKQENAQQAQEERDETIQPEEAPKKSTGNAEPVEIPDTPATQKAAIALAGAPMDATSEQLDALIRRTATVTMPVRKAMVEKEIQRRANKQEDHNQAGMMGEPIPNGQSREELQRWADAVKAGKHPFVHIPANVAFKPAGVEDLTRTPVKGAGAFSGTYYHPKEIEAADIRKAARDKKNPQAALDALVSKFKGEEKPVELTSADVEPERSPVVSSEEPKTEQPANRKESKPRATSPADYKKIKAALLARGLNPEDTETWGTAVAEEEAKLAEKPADEPVTLPPEIATGLTALVEEQAADDPTATLDSVLRDKDTGNFVAQALVNDGILTSSAENVNPKTSLLTTSARAKVGDALLAELLPQEVIEQTPDFLKQKLLGCMGTIGIINSRQDEWNLQKPIQAAVENFNHHFRGEETADPGPVVTAIVKVLDAPIQAMRGVFSTYAIGADSIRNGYAPAGEPEKPFSAFNLAFGTELTQEQYETGLKPVVGDRAISNEESAAGFGKFKEKQERRWTESKNPILQHESDGITYQSRDISDTDGDGILVRAIKNGRRVAQVDIARETDEDAFTTGAEVPEDLQRQGFATKLYKQIPSIAKAYGIERVVGEGAQTFPGRKLWESLARSGAAEPTEVFGLHRLGMKTSGAPDIHKAIESKPLAKGDKVTYRTNKGKERTGEVAWTDGKKVRISDNGSTVNKDIQDVKPAQEAPRSDRSEPNPVSTLRGVDEAGARKPEAAGEATLVDALQLKFESGAGPKDYNGLKKIVAEFDGKDPDQLRMKQGQEAYEAMLNRVASEIVLRQGWSSRVKFDTLTALYEGQPNLSIRTSTSIQNQAYSTPTPLAFVASRFAGIEWPNTTVYEPTAGNGALLIAAPPTKTTANELDPVRAQTLKDEGFRVSQHDAAQWAPTERVDAVVANPPFGNLPGPVKVDGYSVVKLDHLIAAKALGVMKDAGKACIILGAGSREEAGEVTNAARPFFNWLYAHYNVVSDFELEGDLYWRQGASWPVRVIAIDGRVRSAKVSPEAATIPRLKTWGEVYDKAAEHLGSNLEGQRSTDNVAGGPVRGESTNQRPVPGTAAGPNRPADSTGPKEGSTRTGDDGGTELQPGSIQHSGRVPDAGVGSTDSTVRPNGDVARSDRLAEGQPAPRTVRGESTQPDGHPADALSAIVDESNQFQTSYRPHSSKKDVAVMAPKALIGPMQRAMDRIAEEVGDIDQWVTNELGYPDVETMHEAFMGIQTDAIAAAIYQMQRGKAIVVGDQCVAGETRIFDPTRGIHVPIKELSERGSPITVLALTPDGMEPVSASSPFRKGIADLYRVVLKDGKSITVTRNHRFLCSDGWKTIAQGLSVGHSVATALSPEDQKSEGSAATRKASALHYSQTASDSTDHCSSYLSPDGVQLQPDQDTGQASSPSRVDVPSHTPASSRLDGLELSQEHSDLGLSSDLHSRKNSSPSESRGPSSTSGRAVAWYERLLGQRLQSASQSLQLPSSPPELSGEESLHLPALHCGRPSSASSSWLREDGESRLSRQVPTVPQSGENSVQSDITCELQEPFQKSLYADHTGWQIVESIEFVRTDEFFDMWVPKYENYVAEGFVNHNTGVGKGRVAAAVIRWAELHGHIPVFVTESAPLFSPMYADLQDIGSGQTISPLLFNADASITDPRTGTKIFQNPGAMRPVLDRIRETGELPRGRNAVFLTYSQINTDNRQQITLQRIAPNSIFILDESHNAGGDSNTGNFLSELLTASKGVAFLSATWAKRPDNLPLYAGMTDISIAIPDKERVADAIAGGGAPLQAVLTSLLAETGQFVRRERSFDGIEIKNQVDEKNQAEHARISDKVTEVLRGIVRADALYHNLDFARIQAKAKKAGKSAGSKGVVVQHMEFSSIVHNMVKQLLLALKADDAADQIIASIERGEKPVFALENTMGAFLDSYISGHNLKEGDSLAGLDYSKISDRALMRTRYYNETDPMGNKSRVEVPLDDLSPAVRAACDETQKLIDELHVDLPVSPIDHIRNKVEKAGYKIAEITGRSWRIDYSGDVPRLGTVPRIEKKDRVNTATQFNNGGLDALIINRAGSTGISLHASEKFRDQRPRHMIIGQPAGDVNIVMQILGRVNRTGQIVLPRYTFLAVALPAEMRPAINLAKKMKSLNANVSSNTRAATSINAVDLMNKYGDHIVAIYLNDNPEMSRLLGLSANVNEKGEPSGNEGLAMKATGHSALLPVVQQQEFMDSITEAYTNYIDFLDETGQNDLEPKTYDFGARELESKRMYQGVDETSPFGQDAMYGEYSIKRQGKPFTPEEVMERIAETFGPDAMKLPPRERDTLAARQLADHMEELYKPYFAALAHPGAIERAQQMRTRGRQLLSDYRVGTGLRIELNGDQFNGVVTNIEGAKKPSGNPYAPSSLQFTIAVNSGLRQTKVPGSQMDHLVTSNLGRNADVRQLFKDYGTDRQKAKIITGNLLGAFGELKTGSKGRIISFTMDDKTSKLGILMPSKFDIDNDVEGTYAMRTAEGAWKFLEQNGAYLQSSGSEVAVFGPTNSRDEMEIRTKMAKGISGKFFLDPKLLETVQGGEFASSGGLMKATAKQGRELDALRAIMGKIALYAPTSHVDEARSIDEKAKEQLDKPKAPRRATGSVTVSFLGTGALDPYVTKVLQPVVDYAKKVVVNTWKEATSAVKKAGKSGKAMGREVAAALAPASVADTDSLDIMGKALGEPALRLFEAGQFLHSVSQMFGKMTPEEQIEFVDRWQTGKEQPTQDLKEAQEFMQEVMSQQRLREKVAVNLGRKKSSQVELSDKTDYFPNRYKVAPGGEKTLSEEQQIARLGQVSRRPFEGSKAFMKQQRYTLKQAVAEGAVPLGNPVEMLLRRLQEGAKFVAARYAWYNFKDQGLAMFLKNGKKLPPDYVYVDDKSGNVWRVVEAVDGNTYPIQTGRWVIEKDAARLLNNYLSVDHIKGSEVLGAFVKIKNFSTEMKLAISAFHWAYITVENMASGLNVGMDKVVNQGIRGLDPTKVSAGFADIAKSMLASYTAIKRGGNIIQYARNPDEFLESPEGKKFAERYPDFPHLMELLFAGGLRWNIAGQFQQSFGDHCLDAWKNGEIGKGIGKFLPWLSHGLMKPLFEHYIPRSKWAFAVELLSTKLAQYSYAIAQGNKTEEEIAREVAETTDNRFGELNWDSLYLNNDLKGALQFFFRSATWAIGSWRGAYQAVKEQASSKMFDDKMFEKWDEQAKKGDWISQARRATSRLPQLGVNAGWILSMALLTSTLGSVTEKLATGKLPWEFAQEDSKTNGMSVEQNTALEAMHPRLGSVDEHGEPVRMSWPTGLKDYEHGYESPRRYLKSKVSDVAVNAWDSIVINRNFTEDYVFNPNDPFYVQMWQGTKYNAVGDLTPMSADNWMRPYGPQDLSSKVERFTGLVGGAPKSLDRSSALTKALELRAVSDPHKPLTPEQQMEREYSKEQPTQHSLRTAAREKNLTYLDRVFKELSYTDAKALYDDPKTSTTERTQLKPFLDKKRIDSIRAARRK